MLISITIRIFIFGKEILIVINDSVVIIFSYHIIEAGIQPQ